MRLIPLLFLILYSFSVRSNQTAVTDTGQELRWATSRIPMVINSNSQTLQATDAQSIIQASMNEWNNSSSYKVQATSAANSEIKFLQNFSIYGSAVIGVTELSFNSAGVIYKGSIYLNEEDYIFNTNKYIQGGNRVYLGDVVTHELGHLFGLSHSEVLNSTMFFSSFPGQSTVSLDDKAAIQHKYDSSNYGSVSGYVKGGNQIGILGVHVQAISRNTGEIVSTISNEKGYFKIAGLPPLDTYYIYTSPLKNLSSMPANYSNVQTEFCPGSYVGTFFSACGIPGIPQGITLTSTKKNIDIGVVTIGCSLNTSHDYTLEKVQPTFSPLTIFDYADEYKNEKSFVGYFRNFELTTSSFSATDNFRIDLSSFTVSGLDKYVQIKLISQPFASPVEYTMDVLNGGFSILPGPPLEKTQAAPEYIFNVDLTHLKKLSTNPNDNIFDLVIKARKLSNSYMAYTIPSYQLFSTTKGWPYLVSISLMEMTSGGLKPLIDTESNLSDNTSCLEAPFTYAVSNSIPASTASARDTKDPASLAACGTLDFPSDGNPPSSSLPLLVSGFLLSLFASLIIKSSKKFLS